MHVVVAGDSGPIVRTNIYLTVAGVSKCVGFEAYAAISLIPGFGGVGVSISLDMPVSVEACGVATTGLEDEVEVRIRGPGLPYSSPDVPAGLEVAAQLAYAEGTLSVDRIASRLPSTIIAPDAVFASIAGSTAHVAGKLYQLPVNGLWAVIVNLGEEASAEEVVVHSLKYRGILDNLAVMFIDDFAEAVRKHSMIYPAVLGVGGVAKIVEEAIAAGAIAATVDAYGSRILAFTEDLDTALEVLLALSGYGTGIYARLETQ